MPDPASYNLGYVSALTDASSIVDGEIARLISIGGSPAAIAELQNVKSLLAAERAKLK